MKKNWIFRIGMIVMVLTLATACLVGGTFAKYTTTVSGQDTVNVARFGITVNDGDAGGATTYATNATVNLFDDIVPAAAGTVNGAMLAPGSTGEFFIVIDNTDSDVNVDLVDSTVGTQITGEGLDEDTKFISFKVGSAKAESATVAKGNITMGEYVSFGDGETYTRASLKEMTDSLTHTIDAATVAYNEVLVYKVQYAWVDGDDAADIVIGQAVVEDPVTITMTIIITANQVVA